MLPLCADQGIGVIPWSPQARGRLTRVLGLPGRRPSQETDEAFGRMFRSATEEADQAPAVDRVAEVAKAGGVPRAQVALAWLLHKPFVTAPIVGAGGEGAWLPSAVPLGGHRQNHYIGRLLE